MYCIFTYGNSILLRMYFFTLQVVNYHKTSLSEKVPFL
jgi:hypothetical protein